MICPWCSHRNLPRAELCGDCGRDLRADAVCASCSTPNPTDHRFCDACGSALIGQTGRTPVGNLPAAEGPPPPTTRSAAAQAPVRRNPSVGWPKFLGLPDPGIVWDQPAPRLRWSWGGIPAWAARNRVELAVVLLLTIAAGAIRIYRVTEAPGGLHGDEALTGLDAMRVVREGWIGPYVDSALGQTSGPLYLTALVFALSGPTAFTLHLSMALFGVVTIPATYFLARIGFGRWVALFAAAALTFSYWHVFYSRSAFMLIAMPLMTALAAAAILIALRSSSRWAWLLAGVLLGLGVHSYNGYLMFLAIVAVLFGVVLVLGRDSLKPYAARIAVLAIGFVAAAFPLIHFAYSDPGSYAQRFLIASVHREPKLQAAQTVGERFEYFAGRVWDAAILPLHHPDIDFVDGLGGRGAMDPILGLLAYAGFAIAVAKWRSPPHLLLALAFVFGLGVLLLGRENVGELRRSFIIVPFVYILAGVAVVAGGRLAARSLGVRGKQLAYAGGAVVLVAAASLNVWTYFGGVVREEHMGWVYASDLVDALDSAHELGDPGRVYFYSERWPYDYETRLFLYPDTPGTDRSREFGEYSLDRLDEGPATYVLLPPYAEEIDALREKYPGGEAVEEYGKDGVMRYGIYRLP